MQKPDIELFKFMMKYITKLYKDEVSKNNNISLNKIDESFGDDSFWIGYSLAFTPVKFYMNCQLDFTRADFLDSKLFIVFTLEPDIDYSNHPDFAAFGYTKNTLEYYIPISIFDDIFKKIL